jgi:outer membrane protein assembly factor BamB
MDQNPKLDMIWPRVQAEIAAARKREILKRKAQRLAASLGVVLAMAGIAILSGLRLEDTRVRVSWQMRNVSPAIGVAVNYPLDEGLRIFAIHGKDDEQQVVCLDRRTGQTIWSSGVRFSKCRLTVHDTRVYVLAVTNRSQWICMALDTVRGAVLWTRVSEGIPGLSRSTLVFTSGGLCWSEGNQVVALDPATGELRWRKTLAADPWLSAPIAHDNTLFVAGGTGLYAVEAATGALLWSLALPGGAPLPVLNRPMLELGNDRLYWATRNFQGGGTLFCINLITKKTLWSQATDSALRLSFHDGRVFVRSQELCAFDASTGQALWRASIGGCGTLHFKGQRIYLVDAAERARILAMDSSTGKVVWTRKAPSSCNGIVISGKFGFLSGNNQTLYALVLDEPS